MVSSVIHTVTQFFYPSYCYQCFALVPQDQAFCVACFATIKPVVSLIVPVTAARTVAVFAGGAYQDPLRRLIIRKFSQDMLASKYLAALLVQLVPREVLNDVDYIIPVPLHWTRYAWRGYNQAVVMAKVLGKIRAIDIAPALKRVRRTAFQSTLNKQERIRNVATIFSCKKRYVTSIKGKRILLVDDLFTSGATVKSAAKTLFSAGAQEVTALVGCRKI